MWYEILPCLGIITAALTAPTIINYQLVKWQQYGNPYRRELFPKMNLDLYQRDMRLNGNPYVMQGLDAIPDK
ncbi:hypothetical protein GE061_011259 [Apolygus lucorum]|uniref:Uncharacterized protein n=1 Tax=Apolygus lucorum TaxID=248454 RepID=A0A6A4K1J6_APOLU|nr:hypothetical protein GE061_011259 [Apolygus lucorum]